MTGAANLENVAIVTLRTETGCTSRAHRAAASLVASDFPRAGPRAIFAVRAWSTELTADRGRAIHRRPAAHCAGGPRVLVGRAAPGDRQL